MIPCVSPSQVRRRALRTGYTLIEVLLALGLSVIVLAAVSGALTTYARLTTAGRNDVERTRIAQAVLRNIERDLRSVVFRKPESAAIDPATGQAASTSSGGASTTDGSGSDSSSSVTSGFSSGTIASGSSSSGSAFNTGVTGSADDPNAASMTVDPAAAYAGTSLGLVGDETSLVLHISRPSRDMNYQSLHVGDSVGGRTSDLMSVSWFLAVANGEGLQGAVGNLSSGGSVLRATESGAQGLARLSGDHLSLTTADAQGDTRALAESAEIVASEINTLQFQYFDGVSWLPTWDSAAYGALPRAVEIQIGFRPDTATPTADGAASKQTGVEEYGDVYRLVVALPLAQGDVAAGAY